jgi:hypothetical protein
MNYQDNIRLFDVLSAENDANLESFYVMPRELPSLMEETSLIVFGDTGSGKTALFKMMQNQARKKVKAKEARLVVLWKPYHLIGVQSGTGAAIQMSQHLTETIMLAVLDEIAIHPQLFTGLSNMMQKGLVWYLKEFFVNIEEVLEPFLDKTSDLGKSVFQQMRNTPPGQLIRNASQKDMLNILITLVKQMDFAGIWIFLDYPNNLGMENLIYFQSFLSTLAFFDLRDIVFKLFFPSQKERELMNTSAIDRHRVYVYRLTWDPDELIQIVEKRLQVAFGKKDFLISDLCESDEIKNWLYRAGGASPREWLYQTQPLVSYYLTHHLTHPISTSKWKELRKERIPYIWIDEIQQMICVGARKITDLSPSQYNMILYLYHHTGQVVSTSELYFLISLGLNSIPEPVDDSYVPPKLYRGAIDTAIWRLRQIIEPDPKNPLLLTTVRGRGVKLINCSEYE